MMVTCKILAFDATGMLAIFMAVAQSFLDSAFGAAAFEK